MGGALAPVASFGPFMSLCVAAHGKYLAGSGATAGLSAAGPEAGPGQYAGDSRVPSPRRPLRTSASLRRSASPAPPGGFPGRSHWPC